MSAMGPLTGLRVVEFSNIGPVLFSGMLLADMGAEIVLVESPRARESRMPLEGLGDPLRRGRSPIALNLKAPETIATVLEILPNVDVILEGFRPGVMERLGLGPEVCLARNPKLVYGRVTGWGRDGPMSNLAGHDPNYSSLVGLVHSNGAPDRAPMPPLNLADFAGGATYLTMGVLAALAHVRGGGDGQVVDASILDGVASLMTLVYALRAHGMWSDERGANLLDGGCPYGSTYETSDRRYVMVCALEQSFFDEMLRLLELDPAGLPDKEDATRWPELRTILATRFASQPQAHWAALFGESNACVTPVLTVSEATAHPHNVARQVFPGGAGIPAAAPRFGGTPTQHAIQEGPEACAVLQRWREVRIA
jgi:alpha-methylacyl-CoA racemase